MRKPSRTKRAQSMVEVVIIVGLVFLLLVTAVDMFHDGLKESYQNQQNIIASPL